MKNLDKIIVLDLETSGLDPRRHSILEFGAVRLMDPCAGFSMKVRLPFGAEWTQEALDVNGLSLEEITDLALPLPYEGLMAMYDFFGWEEFLFAGQNGAAFDVPFLRETMKAGTAQGVLNWPKVRQRVLDMHSVAIGISHSRRDKLEQIEDEENCWRSIPDPDWREADVLKLDSNAIYKLLGMEPEPTPHRALTGAMMERQAMRIMMGLESQGQAGTMTLQEVA